VLPKTDGIAKAMGKPLDWLVAWFARAVLGLPDPIADPNGSGDRTVDYVQLLVLVLLAILVAIVWSILDRRRRSYPRLAAATLVVLRYVLAQAMLSYGISKILRQQFSDLTPYQLDQRVGDMSPMGLVWTFMGYSTAYTIFAGLAEAVGGALLLWRRTATLGALILIPVMTNVVLLNFCYDVPVKLYSSQLLILAIVIAAPSLRRLIGVALGRAAAEVPPRVRMSPRWERARLIASLTLVASIVLGLYGEFSARAAPEPAGELWGAWQVDSFSVDGVGRPPVTSDPYRWHSAVISRAIVVRTKDFRRGPLWRFKIDAAKHAITVTIDPQAAKQETWTYRLPTADHLVLDGIHDGKPMHVTMHREPDGLLLTRGFHWINERPLNR
jgi:uncharacterized membrane protein YphA (DoxX/SURF4 family)